MVLDLDLFRPDKGGDPERVRANVRKRFDDESKVDRVMELDQQWRKHRWSLDQLNKAKNIISKEYGAKIKQQKAKKGPDSAPPPAASGPQSGDVAKGEKQNEDAPSDPLDLTSLLAAINSINADVNLEQLKSFRLQVEAQVVEINKQMEECERNRVEVLKEVGNLIHPDVPVSNDEENNAIIREYGTILKAEDAGVEKLQSHVDLIEMIDGLNTEKGSLIAGNRGYFLQSSAIWLQQALIQYSLRFLEERNFELIYTPFWMRKQIMSQVAQLSQFDDELYKLTSSKGSEDPEEKYLIATSEQPIAALHLDEWINANSLPLRYGGLSTCFRQEVGSHGRDTRGIFRVHQFEKIEQFVVAAPSKSWEHFHEMIGNSEEFYQTLEIPYRVVSIVSGALNNAAAMKYDLEAFFPGSNAYRELVSVSNCTDYQSRRLQIRYGQTKKMSGQVEYVHMLNGTLCAVTRVICCILENYQTKDGIRIPKVLQEFMPKKYRELIPFVDKSAAKQPPQQQQQPQSQQQQPQQQE
uniref:serine--tRNA ligase n=1 Tax=Aceria tosichella TaxID=561515 RepID=A0A6G1S8L1_9ACAR